MMSLCGASMFTESKNERKWGAGRVSLLARLEAFRTDCDAGWSVAAVYAKHAI
jgi:hypothetical protein